MMTTETQVACRACGAATAEGVTERTVHHPATGVPRGAVSMGVCQTCAEVVRPDEPGAGPRALLHLLRKDTADWRLFGDALEAEGVDAALALKEFSGTDKRVAGSPWEHLPGGLRRAAKGVYARRVLLDRVHASTNAADRPVPPHAPPDGRACLMCGAARSEQWHGPTTTGAYAKPGTVTGYVCDACLPHLEKAGAHGAQALERAVMAHRGREWGANMRLPGLTSWAAEGLPPQDEPWAWVPEIRDPEPPPTLADALQAVEALTARVADLEARLGR